MSEKSKITFSLTVSTIGLAILAALFFARAASSEPVTQKPEPLAYLAQIAN